MSRAMDRQLKEDRALRDAALALVKADLAQLRPELTAQALGERVGDRVSDGAVDVFDGAVGMAGKNRGVLAAVTAAVIVWFARKPVKAFFANNE